MHRRGRFWEPEDLTWREMQEILHEELNGLAERYRVPLVACYLEGKTQDQAAAQLRLAKGTLKERLEARGPSLLRARLVRRGLRAGGGAARHGLAFGHRLGVPAGDVGVFHDQGCEPVCGGASGGKRRYLGQRRRSD